MQILNNKHLNLIANAIIQFQTYTDLYQSIHIDSKAVEEQKEICETQALIIREMIMNELSVNETEKHPFLKVLEEHFIYCEEYFVHNKISNAIRLSWAANSIWDSLAKHFPEHKKLEIPA